eukprot:TRINITY_DN2191_c0_g1_i1.p1 TRINITY_DN2191_c0_g1~~TRINITY_DN2191_c0_g1_i1.p1  ORF type:complete len:544 (-),score=201.07 TRINITY_DN2191_c0_g1_i1:279-1862(-)
MSMQVSSSDQHKASEKSKDIRSSNILAAKAVADIIRTSLGPRGLDKMIAKPNGEVLITNDGATILKEMKLQHPAAKMMVELAKAQDVEAGDGTTSVVILAGSLLSNCRGLFNKGLHPTVIAESYQLAANYVQEQLKEMAIPIDFDDHESLIKTATTSLSSKIVSQYSTILAPICVKSMLRICNPAEDTNIDLNNIRVVSKIGGTIDDTQLVDGLVFTQGSAHKANGPTNISNAKIGLIQFQLSSPKSNMDNSIVIDNYRKMDNILREERNYLKKICATIKKTGCNVLLIQKSILRDALSKISLQFLAQLKIMVVKDIERSDIEFISETLGCTPIASIEAFTKDKLGSAELVEEVSTSGGKVVKITGVREEAKTVTIFCRASNKLILDEVVRSIHDALCVMRSLVKSKFMLPGGGAPEIEMSILLHKYADTLPGQKSYAIRAFAESLEVIPYTLAENAGLSPISIVTELRNKHIQGEINSGINVRKGAITDILQENVFQPLLITQSAVTLSSETVSMILKIDDIVASR